MGVGDPSAPSPLDTERLEDVPGGIAPPAGWRYVPGLDGIRGLAVLAVLAFHGGISFFGGGLLGVDVFFVLSGFLITSLLVSEWSRSGKISFRSFYERRARRLLPALVLTIVFVAFYAYFLADPSTRSTIRGDALATMTYVANWRFIITDQNYFIHFGAPSPLLHTWSLAVEEQFYVVWPTLALLVLRWRRTKALVVVAALLAVASSALGMYLFHIGQSPSRLYYGTDIRIQEVMVGACLAAWWGGTQGLGHQRPQHSVTAHLEVRHWRAVWSDRALLVIGILGTAVLFWALHSVNGSAPFLYRGGFLVVAFSTLALIATVVRLPRSPLALAFSIAPLRYVGRISYGLYLYHWPIFLSLSGPRTGLRGPALLSLRLAVTFLAAAVSYHFIEEPIRRHKWLTPRRLVIALPAVAAATVVVLVLGTMPGSTVSTTTLRNPTPSQKHALSVPTTTATTPARPVRVLMVGDSMTMIMANGLSVESTAWGVDIFNEAVVGCDLFPEGLVRFQGNTTTRAGGCATWPFLWPTLLTKYQPDVVAIGVGRWEVADRQINGTWYSIADPILQHAIIDQLNRAVAVAGSQGAKVALLTLPYVQQTTTAPDGTPWDINQPWRTDAYNALVRQVAAQHPGQVTVIDVNKMLDPNGVYTSYIDGIRVRDTDEEHPSILGGEYLRPLMLPEFVRLSNTR